MKIRFWVVPILVAVIVAAWAIDHLLRVARGLGWP